MESQVKIGEFGWILVLHGEQTIPQITNTGTMQVSAKTAPVVNNQNTERPKTSPENKETKSKIQNSVSKKTSHFPGNSKLGKKTMPPNPEINNILRADSHESTMTLRRTYGMVVSGFENVAKQLQLTSEAAEQFGKTVDYRIRELNSESIKKIKAVSYTHLTLPTSDLV